VDLYVREIGECVRSSEPYVPEAATAKYLTPRQKKVRDARRANAPCRPVVEMPAPATSAQSPGRNNVRFVPDSLWRDRESRGHRR